MRQYVSDHYKLQRLALLPTVTPLPTSDIRLALQNLSEVEQRQLLALILSQGLEFFWMATIQTQPELPFALAWRERLKERCFNDTTRYLSQKKALIELDKLFEKERIVYSVFKGAHIREVVYANPAYRPSADIDLLISTRDKTKAVITLCENGYILLPDPATISHEVSLARNNVHLDLHWHIMRPGRTRIELTDILLESRQRCNFFWGLDNEMSLLVMLSHPVFTKYSTAPQSSIVRLADLQKWLATKETDWNRLINCLEDAGLKTAAWITASILADLTGCNIPEFVYQAIRPTQLKQFFLKQWLDFNLSAKFANYPILPKYIFTLLAHDNFSDIFNFIRIYKEEQKKAGIALSEILKTETRQ